MSVVDDIKARLDIVETVSGYVALQKSGRHFKARCPFHTEKTPSFLVNPERQSWRCFGACASGGDVFSFVMRMEGLDFGQALRLLAQKAGVTLSNRHEGDRNEHLYRINQTAAAFYQEALASPQGQQGMKYLEQRGVSAEARAKFGLGLSPQRWDGLKAHLLALGFTLDQAIEASLVHRGDDGNTWDFFRGRLMFPIHDRQGRVAGFGARALDDSTPKYLNTSKTPIFDKRSILYGLHLAAESIRAQNSGIVVEGYMDAIAAHQYGYTNVVASMGTALTEQQVSQLKSLATSFVLALDPDTAGQEATLRSLESSWRVIGHQVAVGRHPSVGALYQREPLTLGVAPLPAGRDPDELIRADARQWEHLTREAVPLMDYLINAVASRFDLNTGHGKAQAVEALFPIVAATENPFDQERYFRRLAKVLDVNEETLKASIGQLWTGGSRKSRMRPPTQVAEVDVSLLSGDPEDALDDYTLALLLKRPELKELARDFAPEHFHKSESREIFTRWLGSPTMSHLQDSLDESLLEHLRHLTQKELGPIDHVEAALRQCLQRLERRYLQEFQEGLLASQDGSVPPPRELEEPIVDVNSKLKELFSQRVR